MQFLKQSTATAVLIGPFLDSTDGITPETALTVASIDIDLYKFSNTHPLTKTDITAAVSGTSNDMTHVANGFYSLELTTTNTDTAGRLIITANISGACPVWQEFCVLGSGSVNTYDSIAGADRLWVDVQETAGISPSSHRDAIWAVTASAYTTVGTVGEKLNTIAASGAIANAVWEDTSAAHSTVGTFGFNLGVPVNTRMSTGFTVASSAQIADAVWDEAQSGHTTAGTFGRYLDTQSSTVSGIASAIKLVTDKLSPSANQIIVGTVDTVTNTHTPTTTEFDADDITEATADHYNGRAIIFTSGALSGQATSIVDYNNVGGIGRFTVSALTEAPANNTTFIII